MDAQLDKRALSYYTTAEEGLKTFDTLFSDHVTDTLSYLVWCSQKPERSAFEQEAVYTAAMEVWQAAEPTMRTSAGKAFVSRAESWMQSMPTAETFASNEAYLNALLEWQEQSPLSQETAVIAAYTAACEDLQASITQKAIAEGYSEDSVEAQEMLGVVLYVLNPNGAFDAFYTENGESVPEDYDVLSLIAAIERGEIETYLSSEERTTLRQERAADGVAVFLAGNMTKSENVESLMEALSAYGVTKEKYDSFGYTYASIKHMAKTAVVTYRGRLEYELGLLQGQYEEEEAYLAAAEAKKRELATEVSTSFLSTLPEAVSEALEEIGQADLYTLIVGSIFYKLAGLLLPIIYMIMASNNLISGQVDSGSMAYVLSTSTKRSTVVRTQAVYLIGSLFAMFALTTATGCVCLCFVSEDVALTYGNLIFLNIGAFLVLFALSGLCFLTSCIFDRSKRSMAIGGGLSIFALVAAMLGLFGSPVIPSVVRLDALNYFNYATVISLFDVISIIDGTNVFVWKFAILALMGILGYIVGSIRFTKKDLPL